MRLSRHVNHNDPSRAGVFVAAAFDNGRRHAM